MAPYTPGFNPLFLDIRLAALRTDKYTFDVMHFPHFLHRTSEVAVRIAQVDAGMQGERDQQKFLRG
jgi:hypothetical protein